MSVPQMQDDQNSSGGRDADTTPNPFLALYTFATRLAELTGSGKVERLVVDTFAEVAQAEQASLAIFEEREGTRRLPPRTAIWPSSSATSG